MRENLIFCTEKIVARITIWLKRSCMLRVGELKLVLVETKNSTNNLENVLEHVFLVKIGYSLNPNFEALIFFTE